MMNWVEYALIANIGGVLVWTLVTRRRSIVADKLRVRHLRELGMQELEKRLEHAKRSDGPYRTPETSPQGDAPEPEKNSLVLPFSPPRDAMCPACGDTWKWSAQRALCVCDKCEVPHFHQKCWRTPDTGKQEGCKFEWIVRSKLATDSGYDRNSGGPG
jgi:hypothetical protein